MYTKKQKIEIYVNFLLTLFVVEIFNFFIAWKGIITIYTSSEDAPWALPLHWLVPIWTLLYVTLGIAGARIYIKRASHIRNFALTAWVIQLVLNILWPVCFYYLPIPVITPILLTLLFMTIILFMFYSYLIDKVVVLYATPFFLMVVYKMILHWIFYILGLDLVSHMR